MNNVSYYPYSLSVQTQGSEIQVSKALVVAAEQIPLNV